MPKKGKSKWCARLRRCVRPCGGCGAKSRWRRLCVWAESVAFGRGVLSKSNASEAFPAKITGIALLIMILVLNKFFIEGCVLLLRLLFRCKLFYFFKLTKPNSNKMIYFFATSIFATCSIVSNPGLEFASQTLK